jgi:type IV pilus assembly protein PilQ
MSLKHESAGALTRIMIESNSPPLYTVFRPSDRLIIIDLPGGDAARLAPSYTVKSALVDSISVRQSRLGDTSSGRNVSRIEIAVRGEVRDRTAVDGNTLVLEISSAGNQVKAAADQPGLVETTANRKENPSAPSVYVSPTPVRARTATASTPAPDRATAAQNALKPASLVQAVRSESADKGVRVLVDMDGAAQFKDFVLPDPWRVVVDITGVTSAFGNKTFSVGAAAVDRVRVGQPSAGVVRVVVDTKSKLPYRVTREGARLVIAVGQVSATQSTNSVPQPEPAAVSNREIKVAGQRVENQKTEPQKEANNPNIPSNLIAQAGKPSGQSGSNQRVTAQPNTNLPLPKQPATQNPPAVKETIVQPADRSYTRSVADVQRTPSQPSAPQSQPAKSRSELAFCDAGYVGGLISFDLRAGVDLRDMLRFVSQQYGINFIVDKSVTTVPVDIRVTDIPWNQVIDSVLRANRLGAVCESNGRIIRIATLGAIKEEEDQQRAIAEAQNLKVPLVTKIIRLRYARAAGSLGDTGTGAAGRSGGGSSFGSSGGDGGGLSRGTLLSIAEKRLSQRGRIEMDMRTNTLIVTDLPEYVQAVDEIIAQLDKPEPMVEIEARIVIASRNFLRDLGTSVGGAVVDPRDGKTAFLQTTPLQLQPGSKLAPGGQQSSSNNDRDNNDDNNNNSSSSNQKSLGPNLIGPFATEALTNSLANTVLSLTTGALGTGIISMALSASETKGQIRTIASPRITAQDNQTAEIVNGVQIPVQTVSNNTITTTFVTAALRLEITPQIVEETGEVLMHVVAENNTVNFALANQFNNGTPGINTQSAESTVRISDGGTTVMGGINIDDEGQTLTRTPGLSKVPLVGELFKRRSTRRDFSEILFFITPRIVRQDGTVGPRLAPQRSSNEGVQNPAGTQRASGTQSPAQKPAQKPAQPVQANATANKGGR